MEAWKQRLNNKAAQLIAVRLNKENADSNVFAYIAEMAENSTVNALNLKNWAEMCMERLMDDCLEDTLDESELRAYNFSFIELMFISEHSREIVNFLDI